MEKICDSHVPFIDYQRIWGYRGTIPIADIPPSLSLIYLSLEQKSECKSDQNDRWWPLVMPPIQCPEGN